MKQDKIEEDRKLIAELGGNTVLANLIGVTPQRVRNWKSRGIPPARLRRACTQAIQQQTAPACAVARAVWHFQAA